MRSILAACLVGLLAGCSGGGGGGSAPPTLPPASPKLELLAGHWPGAADAQGVAPGRLAFPGAVATDGRGNVYAAISGGIIGRLDRAGRITPIQTGFFSVMSLAAAADGTLFLLATALEPIEGSAQVASITVIAKVSPAGLVTRLAASQPWFQLTGIATDGVNAYVADLLSVRVVAPDGSVRLLAGGAPGPIFTQDGFGAAAKFEGAAGLGVDAAGNLYVADQYANRIRRISPDGFVSTVAGTGMHGAADGPGHVATFSFPRDIGADAAGNVYVLDGAGSRVRRISWVGGQPVVSTVWTGPRASGLAVDPDGTVYVSTSTTGSVFTIGAEGVQPWVGIAPAPALAEGRGAEARFGNDLHIAIDRAGTVWVADRQNDALRTVTPDGTATTVLRGDAASGRITSVGIDAGGRVLVGSSRCEGDLNWDGTCYGRIRVATPEGGWQDLVARHPPAGRWGTPTVMKPDAAGSLYVIDSWFRRGLKKVTPAGDVVEVTSFALQDIAIDRDGTLLAAIGHGVVRLTAAFYDPVVGSPLAAGDNAGGVEPALLRSPNGIAFAESGVLHIADTGNHVLRKLVAPNATAAVAGTPGVAGFRLGTLPGLIESPGQIAFHSGALYIVVPGAILVVRDPP